MAVMQYDTLLKACTELFGPEVETSPDFLQYLQHSGVKSAFRRRAKETHPDTSGGARHHSTTAQAERFRRVKEAYETLLRFIAQREQDHGRMRGAVARQWHDERRDVPGMHPGAVPQHPLQIGRYLYYRKAITFRDLLRALAWQRSTRAPLGAIAREWGWMSAADVGSVMTADVPGRFGEKAIRLGLINEARLRLMLTEQKLRHRQLGQYFTEHRLLTPQELQGFLRELKLHNARFTRGDVASDHTSPWQ